MAIGDLNGDARLDVVVSNSVTNDVAVFINKTRRTPDHDDDGVTTVSDCAPSNRNAWAVPAPATGILLEGVPSTKLSWYPQPAAGGSTVRYDVLRSVNPANFTSASCLVSTQTGRVAFDTAMPVSGSFFYLIRAENPCGGNIASRSDGSPRAGINCQ